MRKLVITEFSLSISFACISVLIAVVLSSAFPVGESYALTYSNYTSDKYKIEFEHPSDWQVTEKKSRFDEGTDIQINSPTISDGYILIQSMNRSAFQGMDIREAVYELFKESITGDYSNEYKVIEQPTFSNIDNQTTGTWLFTSKDKYEENALKWATQRWLVKTPDNGYLIGFSSTPDVFDSPAATEVRDRFLKSIKFLGINATESSQPSRFD